MKMNRKEKIIFWAPAFLFAGCLSYFFLIPMLLYWSYQPKVGDLVFQSLPESKLVIAIEGCTNSPVSHCGIVVKRDGQWKVLEAYGEVKEVSLDTFFMRSRLFQFAVYRLKDDQQPKVQRFIQSASKYLGKDYDQRYKLDQEKIYCSELIYHVYEDVYGEALCALTPLKEMNWRPYEQTIRYFEKGDPPLNREIVMPISVMESQNLERVIGWRL